MACLAYDAGRVNYRSTNYERSNLISVRSNILESYWLKVKNCEPWNEMNLNTVFDQGRPLLKAQGSQISKQEKIIPENL